MNLPIARVALLVTTAFVGACGKTLDVGSDPPGTCSGDAPRVLSSLADLPDFIPRSIVIVGDAAYVGGLSFPGRNIDGYAAAGDPGRIVRFPLAGGPPQEVWRGAFLGPLLKVYGSRIVFTELYPTEVPSYPVWSGLHVYDAETGALTDVANLPGRDFVADFDIGHNGLIFAAGTLAEPDDVDGASHYAIARWSDGEAARVVELRGRPAHFFRRGDDVLLQLPADDSTTGNDLQDSARRTHAVFSLDGDHPVLERRLNELGDAAEPGVVDHEVIHGDATSYYVIARAPGFANVGRLSRQGSADYSAVASIGVRPVFDGYGIDWVSPDDRSTVRRRALQESASESVEVVFDARRQVQTFALAGCRLAWISASAVDAAEPFRLMVGRSR